MFLSQMKGCDLVSIRWLRMSPRTVRLPIADCPVRHNVCDTGLQFEDMIRQKNLESPDFTFLRGGPGVEYYRWRVHCARLGMTEGFGLRSAATSTAQRNTA